MASAWRHLGWKHSPQVWPFKLKREACDCLSNSSSTSFVLPKHGRSLSFGHWKTCSVVYGIKQVKREVTWSVEFFLGLDFEQCWQVSSAHLCSWRAYQVIDAPETPQKIGSLSVVFRFYEVFLPQRILLKCWVYSLDFFKHVIRFCTHISSLEKALLASFAEIVDQEGMW